MADNTEIRVDIESLKKDIENVNAINGKLDTAIDKLTDVSTSIKSMLCLLYTSPSPRDGLLSRMPSSA